MDNFMVATQNQLSFNKMLGTDSTDHCSTSTSKQWGSISEPHSREREVHLHCVQGKGPEIYWRILEGVDPGNAMTPNKEPSAAENFSVKSTQCIKNVTPTMTSSLVTPVA
jgi:hypothetical protein